MFRYSAANVKSASSKRSKKDALSTVNNGDKFSLQDIQQVQDEMSEIIKSHVSVKVENAKQQVLILSNEASELPKNSASSLSKIYSAVDKIGENFKTTKDKVIRECEDLIEKSTSNSSDFDGVDEKKYKNKLESIKSEIEKSATDSIKKLNRQ